MKQHVEATIERMSADLTRVSELLGTDNTVDVVNAAIDVTDRLIEERAWLRTQPLSSLLDEEARRVMMLYRITVIQAALWGESFLRSEDPEDIAPWLEKLVRLGDLYGQTAVLPDD